MHRNGVSFKPVILILFLIATVYLLYLYNTTLGRLRDAEATASHFKKEEEVKTEQLQGKSHVKLIFNIHACSPWICFSFRVQG